MKKVSGGLVLFKANEKNDQIFVLVAHPGGPFFQNKDEGWWSIPKGEPEPNEEIFDAAVREFEEETGMPSQGPYLELGSIIQKNGKEVFAWAFEAEWSEGRQVICNEITMEYPKGSGKMWTFPEIDRALFLPADEAKQKLQPEQAVLVNRLIQRLSCIAKATAGKD